MGEDLLQCHCWRGGENVTNILKIRDSEFDINSVGVFVEGRDMQFSEKTPLPFPYLYYWLPLQSTNAEEAEQLGCSAGGENRKIWNMYSHLKEVLVETVRGKKGLFSSNNNILHLLCSKRCHQKKHLAYTILAFFRGEQRNYTVLLYLLKAFLIVWATNMSGKKVKIEYLNMKCECSKFYIFCI